MTYRPVFQVGAMRASKSLKASSTDDHYHKANNALNSGDLGKARDLLEDLIVRVEAGEPIPYNLKDRSRASAIKSLRDAIPQAMKAFTPAADEDCVDCGASNPQHVWKDKGLGTQPICSKCAEQYDESLLETLKAGLLDPRGFGDHPDMQREKKEAADRARPSKAGPPGGSNYMDDMAKSYDDHLSDRAEGRYSAKFKKWHGDFTHPGSRQREKVYNRQGSSPQEVADGIARSIDRSARAEHSQTSTAHTYDGEVEMHRYNIIAYSKTIGGISLYEAPPSKYSAQQVRAAPLLAKATKLQYGSPLRASGQSLRASLSYEQFKSKYEELLKRMLSYSPDQAGSNVLASELADLVEQYPEFEEQYDNQFKAGTLKAGSYIDTFFREKNLPEQTYEVKSSDGTPNWIPSSAVIEQIKRTSGGERKQIEDMLRRIDFANGDVHHFLKHLAGAMAISFKASGWDEEGARKAWEQTEQGIRDREVPCSKGCGNLTDPWDYKECTSCRPGPMKASSDKLCPLCNKRPPDPQSENSGLCKVCDNDQYDLKAGTLKAAPLLAKATKLQYDTPRNPPHENKEGSACPWKQGQWSCNPNADGLCKSCGLPAPKASALETALKASGIEDNPTTSTSELEKRALDLRRGVYDKRSGELKASSGRAWEEYDSAAEWVAKRGGTGAPGEALPSFLSVEALELINDDIDAFQRRVRETAYALAMEETGRKHGFHAQRSAPIIQGHEAEELKAAHVKRKTNFKEGERVRWMHPVNGSEQKGTIEYVHGVASDGVTSYRVTPDTPEGVHDVVSDHRMYRI